MTNGKNGKVTNGTAKEQNGQKVIPKDVWKDFATYWDNCEWKDLKIAEIKTMLGKYVFVPIPKDITNKDIGTKWYNEIKEFREKGVPFGGITVNFAGQKDSIESIFGNKPLTITEVTKRIHFFINDKHLSSKGSEPKASSKPEEKNGKKTTVKVNTVEEMEKEVAKLKPKKGK